MCGAHFHPKKQTKKERGENKGEKEKRGGKNPAATTESVIQFLAVVFVPRGNLDEDVRGAIGHGLAAKAGLRRDARRFVQLVELGVGSFVAGFETFPHDDVARRAGADAAASVVEAGLGAFGNVENAAREAVVPVRNFLRVNLDGLATRKKCDFEFLRRGLFFFL